MDSDDFFGFDPAHPDDDLGAGLEREDDHDFDALNDETFGTEANTGDWENQHRQLSGLEGCKQEAADKRGVEASRTGVRIPRRGAAEDIYHNTASINGLGNLHISDGNSSSIAASSSMGPYSTPPKPSSLIDPVKLSMSPGNGIWAPEPAMLEKMSSSYASAAAGTASVVKPAAIVNCGGGVQPNLFSLLQQSSLTKQQQIMPPIQQQQQQQIYNLNIGNLQQQQQQLQQQLLLSNMNNMCGNMEGAARPPGLPRALSGMKSVADLEMEMRLQQLKNTSNNSTEKIVRAEDLEQPSSQSSVGNISKPLQPFFTQQQQLQQLQQNQLVEIQQQKRPQLSAQQQQQQYRMTTQLHPLTGKPLNTSNMQQQQQQGVNINPMQRMQQLDDMPPNLLYMYQAQHQKQQLMMPPNMNKRQQQQQQHPMHASDGRPYLNHQNYINFPNNQRNNNCNNNQQQSFINNHKSGSSTLGGGHGGGGGARLNWNNNEFGGDGNFDRRNNSRGRDDSFRHNYHNSSNSFDRSAASSFDRSVASNFDRNAASSFDRNAASSFDRNAASSFDRSAASSFDRSAASSFDRSTASSFDRSAASSFDRSAASTSGYDRTSVGYDRAGNDGGNDGGGGNSSSGSGRVRRDSEAEWEEWERKRELDEYAGLMTPRQKSWLRNIQSLQLATDNPYVDDYYYVMYDAERTRAHPDSPLRIQGLNMLLPVVGEQEKDTGNPYQPPAMENSLGKLQVASVNAPRKIMDLQVVHFDSNEPTSKLQMEMRTHRQLLLSIEKQYGQLMELEDLDRKVAYLPDSPTRDSFIKRAKQLADSMWANLNQDAAYMQLVLGVRKGKTLVANLVRRLGPVAAQSTLDLVLTNLPQLTRESQPQYQNTLNILWPTADMVLATAPPSLLLQFASRLLPHLKNPTSKSQEALTQLEADTDTNNKDSELTPVLASKFGISVIVGLLVRGEQVYSDMIKHEVWQEFLSRVIALLASVQNPELITNTLVRDSASGDQKKASVGGSIVGKKSPHPSVVVLGRGQSLSSLNKHRGLTSTNINGSSGRLTPPLPLAAVTAASGVPVQPSAHLARCTEPLNSGDLAAAQSALQRLEISTANTANMTATATVDSSHNTKHYQQTLDGDKQQQPAPSNGRQQPPSANKFANTDGRAPTLFSRS